MDPTPPKFHLALGVLSVGIRDNANFSVRVGVMKVLAFLDTNMLVSPMGNCGVWGLSQREDPM